MFSIIVTRWVVERSCLFAVIVMVLAPILATFVVLLGLALVLPGAGKEPSLFLGLPLGAPIAGFPAAFLSLQLIYALSEWRGVTTITGVLIGAVASGLWSVVLVRGGATPGQGWSETDLLTLGFFTAVGSISALISVWLGEATGAIKRADARAVSATPDIEERPGKRTLSHIEAVLEAYEEERRQRGL